MSDHLEKEVNNAIDSASSTVAPRHVRDDGSLVAPRLISLFSGCGGMDLGFKKAGFNIVWANDFDPDAQAVYSLNIGNIDGRNILNVDENEIPDGDILIAGFPCQPFSNAGLRKGVHDSRGLLYKECFRIIEKKMPKVIVFENVKGLLSTKNIDGRNLADVIESDLSNVNNVGYNVKPMLVNASDYGVPQNRQRVFFVGVRKDLNKTFVFPCKKSKVGLALGNVLENVENAANNVDWPLSPQALEMIEYIPEGGSWKDVPYQHLAPRFQRIRDDMKRYHSPNFYRRFGRDEICGTITASAQPENCGIVHPTQNRRLTVREVARIQTFPDDFTFITDSMRDIIAMYKVIGNAVPVQLAYCIANAIMEQVFLPDASARRDEMNTDKAYLLGLIIGGGYFGNAEDAFRIRLPFKKWGSYIDNPKRAGEIAGDIIRTVGQMFRAIYNLSVSYETTPGGTWTILCEGDLTPVRSDLIHYGIPCDGEIRGAANITELVKDLVDDNLKRRFVAGLADTIGSMAESHRRFTEEHQIMSFEIKGYNFKFVCDLCRLLHSINCIPDQINWNHPNIHCTKDPYYKQWNKGFKLRILLDQYARFGAFAFRTKAEASNEQRLLQKHVHVAEDCKVRDFNVTPSSVHPAEWDERLPENIRGGHYIHFRHFCAVMGCEHAPCDKLQCHFSQLGNLINPFPILCKGSEQRIEQIINGDRLLAYRCFKSTTLALADLLAMYKAKPDGLVFGSKDNNGYPLTELIQAVAFVIADKVELFGNRPKNCVCVIENHVRRDPTQTVVVGVPDLLTVLNVSANGRSALVGARNPDVYQKLITFDPHNSYKILVRKITEDDLRDA